MYSDIRNGSRAARAGAFMALWVMLAMELGIARIRLSDKISRLHPRWAAAELG
jgi:hypothetical protein